MSLIAVIFRSFVLLLTFGAKVIFAGNTIIADCFDPGRGGKPQYMRLAGFDTEVDQAIAYLEGKTNFLPPCDDCHVRILHGYGADFEHLVPKNSLGTRKIVFTTDLDSLPIYRQALDDPERLLKLIGYQASEIQRIIDSGAELRIQLFKSDTARVPATWKNSFIELQKQYPANSGRLGKLLHSGSGEDIFDDLESLYRHFFSLNPPHNPKNIFKFLTTRSIIELKQYFLTKNLSLKSSWSEIQELRTFLFSQANYNPLYRGDGFIHDGLTDKAGSREYLFPTELNGQNSLLSMFGKNQNYFKIILKSHRLNDESMKSIREIMSELNQYEIDRDLRENILFSLNRTKNLESLKNKLKALLKLKECQ